MTELVRLGGETDWPGFREAARRLVACGVPPDDVRFESGAGAATLFDMPPVAATGDAAPTRLAVPAIFLKSAEKAALHSDPERWQLLYRLLWRIALGEAGVAQRVGDADMARVVGLAKAVRRDAHKMTAFVRFRQVEGEAPEQFVAWFEPDHWIVEATAPFFAERFSSLRWSILTPKGSVGWDGASLAFGPSASRADAPGDDRLDALWRVYYRNMFNPARVSPQAMRGEMPKKYWRNLPEARDIPTLLREAGERARTMIAAPPTIPPPAAGRIAARLETREEMRPAEGLGGLRREAAGCRACSIGNFATQTVFGEGPEDAEVMLVGEQPGDEEDLRGRPFAGPAGRLLDRALAEAGLDRSRLYLTNAVKHFKFAPRGKLRLHRRPDAGEVAACRPWIEREVATVDPRLIVAMGATAASVFLPPPIEVKRLRGRFLSGRSGARLLVTTHPAYVLRVGEGNLRARAFAALADDLRLVRDALAEPAGKTATTDLAAPTVLSAIVGDDSRIGSS